jgi:hypothetical protein
MEIMKDLILEQIQNALSKRKGLDGTIHGLRIIKQGKHGSRSSLFYSAKNGSLIPVESRLERSLCYRLEVDENVDRYLTKSIAVPYRGNYLYPDFLIVKNDGEILVREVKHSRFLGSRRNSEKIRYLSLTFERIGIPFAVVTDGDLNVTQQHKNEIELYDRGGRSRKLTERLDLLPQIFSASLTVSEARATLTSYGLPKNLLEAAIFHRILRCDMNAPIAPSTRLELCQ